jgi:hypothetical protein
LQKELEDRDITVNEKENRTVMIRILEDEMVKEMQTKKIGELCKRMPNTEFLLL